MAGPGCSKRCATATWAAGTAAAATCPRATARSIAAPADRPPIRSTHGRPAMTQWYYSDYERNRHGPVGAADLAALHADGQLDPATLVWREGMTQWQPWHTVMAEVVPETAPPAEDRASFPTIGRAACRERGCTEV